jgi:hypothetical protein
MKVNKNNQFGLNFTQEIKDHFYKLHSEKYFKDFTDEESAPFRKQWLDILSDEGNKNLLFSQTAIDVCKNIKLTKFEPAILKIKKSKKITLLIDDNKFYRVAISEDEIMALCIKKTVMPNNQYYVSYDSFKIYPKLNTVSFPMGDYMKSEMFLEFIKMLIFIEFSDVTEVLLKPNQSIGTKKEGKYLNDSKNNFILVDSKWNNIIVSSGVFGVSGHFRLQRVGKDKQEVKLIYIKEFVKNGYVRGLKKEQLN